jgi:hypothetical protein
MKKLSKDELLAKAEETLKRVAGICEDEDLAEAKYLVEALRDEALYEKMGALAEAVSRRDPKDARNRRLYGQYLINTGKATAAVTVPGVGFSADGRYFIFTQVEKAGSGGSLNVFRRSGSRLAQDAFEPLGVLRMDNSPYLATFSPDSRRVAVSHDNGDVTLFDLDTGQQTGRLRAAGSEAGRLAISPDGKMLAVHHFDDTISLWDLATLAPLGRPIGNLPRALLGLAFSADSRLLITGGQLDIIVGYDLAVESWIAQACDVAHRQLTPEERANYRLPSQGPRACTPQ